MTPKTKTPNKKLEKLETTNIKILEFYENTNLDFESMNLLIIDIYDKMSNDLTGNIDKKMSHDILTCIKADKKTNDQFRKDLFATINTSVEMYKSEISTIKTFNTILTNEINGLREMMTKMNNDINNTIIAKLFEIKQNYIDELKNIISSTGSLNTLRLVELVEKENASLVLKTLNAITDIIPKSNTQNIQHLELLINNFKSEINNNIGMMKSNNETISLEEISLLIDNKYTNLLSSIQQTILMNVNSSENRITKNILELKDFELVKQTNQETINNDLLQYLNKFKNSTVKGAHGESKLINVLQDLYISGEIINTSGEGKKCDIMLKRTNKPTLLIENKTYQAPVSKDEIIKFCRDVEHQNYCGIMFSQTSNISTKENYQIDIINNNILLYVSNCEYDPDKIKMAISIIDHLYPKINELSNKNTTAINNDTMVLINEEYKRFLNQREAIKNYMNDTNKKLISQLYEMEMPNLNCILASIFTIVQEVNLTCDYCKKFVGINKKSLSKHQHSCKKKNSKKVNITSDDSISQDEIKDNDTIVSDDSQIKELIDDQESEYKIISLEDELKDVIQTPVKSSTPKRRISKKYKPEIIL